ncbi:MAG: GTP 3',8-cyclase MoaA [Chloroflexi bacterium]|nr:GTP 3',8-cyclase MoaA [Chloroflexota bacterium]
MQAGGLPVSEAALPADQPLADRFGRPLRDLRISVTDRCNFRCRYCMPREVFGADFEFLPRDEILTFEEIARIAGITAQLGVRKIRLTGGEPTLRAELPELVRLLKEAAPAVELAMTTNGSRLTTLAGPLAEAGLDRVTVSLDTLDDATFRAMNDADFPVALVLEGIEAAAAAGLAPIKVNAVVKRGVNDDGVAELARRFKGTGTVLRFIEYMDVGVTNGWRLDDVVPARELVERIDAALPIEPLEPSYRGEVAKRWRYRDGEGEIGFITSVSAPFCGDCTRARISADGSLYTCLFAVAGTDLRAPLREGADDAALAELLTGVWSEREDRYSEIRSADTEDLPRIEMSYIGG